MRLRTTRSRRAGVIALDAVICTSVAVGFAAALYAVLRVALGGHLAFIETAVGSPLM